MELQEIRYFLAVCDTLNFTRAAERCHVSQPALTRAIQKLEGEFGGLLFSRERGRVTLTGLGRLVQPELEQALGRTGLAKERAERFLRLESAELRIGVTGTIGPLRFAGCLAQFRAEQPGIAVTLGECHPAALVERLLAGQCDAALMAQPAPYDAEFRAEPLYPERFLLACGAAHRFARQGAVDLRDLAGEAWLERTDCEFAPVLAAALEAAGVGLVPAWRSGSESWIQTMVAAGVGICLAPEFLLTHPELRARPLQGAGLRREVSLVTVAGRRWSKPLASFVALCRRYPWGQEAALPSVAA